MIKRTLYFGNPAYLSTKLEQLVIKFPDVEKNPNLSSDFKQKSGASIPIEDIGVVVLDHQQITITQFTLHKLMDNNVAVITCNEQHLPCGLLLPIEGNTTQAERYKYQIETSLPFKKQLWQQTVQAKIKNQAYLMQDKRHQSRLLKMALDVKSGDAQNHEAQAAALYWRYIFHPLEFFRHREGAPPNNILNYGYALLRATMARCLVGSGLLPTLGIFHRNRYNAYALADDMMEPYRPLVDKLVLELLNEEIDMHELSPAIKSRLLSLPAADVLINGEKSPLMIAMQRTSASLAKCFEGKQRKLLLPEII
jgi:CRISPR-associated protein Cas1